MLGFIICSPFSLEARRQTGHSLLTEVVGSWSGLREAVLASLFPRGGRQSFTASLSS